MKRVLLGMSGGVDSSVSALLLKEMGYEVIGITLELFAGSCCNIETNTDAKNVCKTIGIPHITYNLKEQFKCRVIDNFIDEYSKQRTPNPCIECNRYMKFGLMYEKAKELNCDYIATGHYAKMEYSEKYGRYVLKKSKNIAKDQSYVLYNLPKELLGKVVFPLGDFNSKEEIREIARKNNLKVANKPDSEDICFVPDGDYAGYLENEAGLKAVPGDFVDIHGNAIGRHKGIIHYTIGQRKGLGLAMGHPVFVVDIIPETNQVVIGENGDVFSERLICNRLNFMSIEDLTEPMHVKAKIRYNHKGSMCTIRKIDEDLVEAVFDEPVRAVTKGQAVVFYEDDHVLGGGSIC